MTAMAPPIEQRPQTPPKYAPILKKVDVFRLAGSKLDPDEELSAASGIWSQCGIELTVGWRTDYDEDQTRKLLAAAGDDEKKPVSELRVLVSPTEPSHSVRNLRNEWFKTKRGSYAAFFAPSVFLTTSGASSAADPDYDIVYIGERRNPPGWDLAHELGHRLIGPHIPHAGLRSPLMRVKSGSLIVGKEIVELECRAARGEHKARYELERRRREY